MPRFILAASLLLCTVSAVAASAPISDPLAVALAQQSVAALTGGTSVTDVTLNGNVISVLGSDSGTGTFEAKGTGASRVDLNLNSGTRSEVRSTVNGVPGGAWEKNGAPATAYAQHNNWTDATWFFPALSSLTQISNPNFIFKYVGQEQHGGITVQHIQTFQVPTQPGLTNSPVASLSRMDFYLDPVSYLPLAIAFNTHADTDMGVDIPIEVRFANYQAVSGIQVPFHIQRMLNGSLVLDLTVTTAVFNTGLLDSSFTLP